MSNADLINRLNEPELYYPGNFDTPKRANAMLSGLCQEAADALAIADKRIAELGAMLGDAERSSEYWKAEHLAGNKAVDEAERKLAVAREALESCGVNHGLNGPQQYYDESLVDTALAQIGGEDEK